MEKDKAFLKKEDLLKNKTTTFCLMFPKVYFTLNKKSTNLIGICTWARFERFFWVFQFPNVWWVDKIFRNKMSEFSAKLFRVFKFELRVEKRCNHLFFLKYFLLFDKKQLISIWENLMSNLKPDNLMKYRQSALLNRKNSKS